ncbi:hypothetical protein C2869_01145 [Saccharobesus litoralis]|uniref:MobA-like NTP transferase domain-containing protein n=1 Tax=Saccharobesus litoralis TaxID=2172099 RepID=A0A2S0VLQ6_9ALTE|nr:nucleotidyltransferase family protein [Saccharobesus litoralis]AWB65131.1 hypothetical protein C2869_01145 [Saccharobesus litoralis]
MKIELLLMAAGEGKRFGGRKQLANISGSPLILKKIDQMTKLVSQAKQHDIDLRINVILGAYANEIFPKLPFANANLNYFVNPNWREGLGNSISFGCLSVLSKKTNLKGVDGIMVCLLDQANLTLNDYLALLAIFQRNPKVNTCAEYLNQKGVPAIFTPNCFSQLKSLTGDKGAQGLLTAMPTETVLIENAKFDLDTQQDLASLR